MSRSAKYVIAGTGSLSPSCDVQVPLRHLIFGASVGLALQRGQIADDVCQLLKA